MRQPILLAASLLVCLAAPPVWAADPDFLAAGPPPMPRAALADPGAEEPEHARRPWELAVRGAAASPGCLGGALLGCDDLGAGGAWGTSVVYRLTPLVGLGAEVTRASLRGEGGGGVATALGAQATPVPDSNYTFHESMVVMRDGTKLHTTFFVPRRQSRASIALPPAGWTCVSKSAPVPQTTTGPFDESRMVPAAAVRGASTGVAAMMRMEALPAVVLVPGQGS